jgi:hypothetical protein
MIAVHPVEGDLQKLVSVAGGRSRSVRWTRADARVSGHHNELRETRTMRWQALTPSLLAFLGPLAFPCEQALAQKAALSSQRMTAAAPRLRTPPVDS